MRRSGMRGKKMNLGHRRPCISSLLSATIKRKLICGLPGLPLPLQSPIWTHTQTQTHTQLSQSAEKGVHPPFGSTIRFPKQQVRSHRAQHHTCTHWATSHFSTTSTGCSQIYAWLWNTDSHIKSRQWHESNLPGTYNSNLVLSTTSALILLLWSGCGDVQEKPKQILLGWDSVNL